MCKYLLNKGSCVIVWGRSAMEERAEQTEF